MAQIDQLLIKLVEAKGSDLHLRTGVPVRMRVDGQLRPINDRRLEQEQMSALMQELCREEQWRRFLETSELDFAYSVPGVSRFRCNYLKQWHGFGAVFRVIPEKISTLADLGLPPAVERFPAIPRGLVLVTGPTGSGKSTTLAAIIDAINRAEARHIITIEDPIEFVHTDARSHIVQREVGLHTPGFSRALKDALSEDPDVILVGEMRDLETISLAVTAAEMGVLVFGTVHTNSASKTIDRIVDVFPTAQKEQIRSMLAESLAGIISQQLLRRIDRKGRVAATEILLRGPGFGNLIREGSASKIHSYIDTNRALGMQTLDQTLRAFVEQRVATAEEAYLKCNNKKEFEEWLASRTVAEAE